MPCLEIKLRGEFKRRTLKECVLVVGLTFFLIEREFTFLW